MLSPVLASNLAILGGNGQTRVLHKMRPAPFNSAVFVALRYKFLVVHIRSLEIGPFIVAVDLLSTGSWGTAETFRIPPHIFLAIVLHPEVENQ